MAGKGMPFEDFGLDADQSQDQAQEFDPLTVVRDVPVAVRIVLGRSQQTVGDILALKKGAVVALDRKVGEAVDVLVNGRVVARGELVIVDEGRLGVNLTEIVKQGSQE